LAEEEGGKEEEEGEEEGGKEGGLRETSRSNPARMLLQAS